MGTTFETIHRSSRARRTVAIIGAAAVMTTAGSRIIDLSAEDDRPALSGGNRQAVVYEPADLALDPYEVMTDVPPTSATPGVSSSGSAGQAVVYEPADLALDPYEVITDLIATSAAPGVSSSGSAGQAVVYEPADLALDPYEVMTDLAVNGNANRDD
jgi:hypothetical protein